LQIALAGAHLVQVRKPAPARFTVAWIASAHALAMRKGCATGVAPTRLLQRAPLQWQQYPSRGWADTLRFLSR
jgi:hypothetical protein